ncbi:hypothetical protein TPHA_0H01050 [Tetrapisispora phaffii CBS 4417]|uniref:SPX domain-containing protein n=1 Tax=Tetrapisispora phaffii (strain ATCC 24235 / CBS 4417 / NBRC 1672 / NRRL Y-8282 / UCD 70-5) TaxID=1071381 RepID=G8BX09_TETPH|nr:hypothetical protein TPHA_0H01050 [Tetrapisispora phaffii CBS 4417]CCE64313.1 hypothetical protein TPHA_0H01050 [Tetrapisispora phaffii CBS 4417]
MKFGKHLEARQIEIPEHNGYFIDYKSLKKLIKQLAFTSVKPTDESNAVDELADTEDNNIDGMNSFDESIIYKRLQENQSSFFFKLERELEKVNSYYLEKELNLHIKYDILQKKFDKYKNRGKLTSKDTTSYKIFLGGIKKFQKDLDNLEQYVKLNRTGFLKVLKKWDKRSHSQQKEFYFATVISVQPIFTKNDISVLNDSILTLLITLDEICSQSYANPNGSNMTRNSIRGSVDHEGIASLMRDTKKNDTVNTVHDELTDRHSPINVVNNQITDDTNNLQLANFDYEMEIESEIEDWYKELIYIDKIKDETRKKNMLTSFFDNKIKYNVEQLNKNNEVDLNIKFRDSTSKLFSLLIDSELSDDALQTFYESVKLHIDLAYFDESDVVFSRRNILHESARCMAHSRHFILQEAFKRLPTEVFRKLLNAKDSHLRIPLHYASEFGKLEFVKLIIASQLLNSVDDLDNNSHTPMSLAIINNHNDIVKTLLLEGNAKPSPESDESSNPQFAPLIIACESNNYDAAKLLLQIGSIEVNKTTDYIGLGCLHIVAKRGGSKELIKLLISNGADANGIDEFNKWTPLIYAVQEGHSHVVTELLDNGADAEITDENDRGPLFYAIWEGHINVLNLILKKLNSSDIRKRVPSTNGTVASNTIKLDDDFDEIPDFALPPPIIPLRKYGHNFLEKKTFVKIILKSNQDFIKFNQDDGVLSLQPGRITLTSNSPESFPRNIILPIKEEEDSEIIFQVDSFEKFNVDFEIYPSYGTRLLAKTTVIPNMLNLQSLDGTGTASMPLFDYKLKYIGTLTVDYQIIFPCNIVKPLDISKYETYWKSTTSDNTINNSIHEFVTSSSLKGSYLSVKVSSLRDGTVVVTPSVYLLVGGVNIFMLDLDKEQLERIIGYDIEKIPEFNNSNDLKHYLKDKVVTLEKLLATSSSSIQLDIQVAYPTEQEFGKVLLSGTKVVDLNSYIDTVLLTTFEHIRDLRHSGKSLRSIMFSSCNIQACSIINWKQPNFAVIFIINSLYKLNNEFIMDTAHRLRTIMPKFDTVLDKDDGYYCIHEKIKLSANNNLLGIVIPNEILQISPQLAEIIRANGLLLISSNVDHSESVSIDDNINGVLVDSELEFSRIN